jgi:PilZ domain
MSPREQALPRRSKRVPAQIPIQLVLQSLFFMKAHKARTLDISRAGARVRTNIRMSPGQPVKVVPSEGIKRAIPGRIVWVKNLVDNTDGEVGIEFFPA